MTPVPVPVRALFQQRIAGDDALLRLAARRFAEAGMPAEVYADRPEDLSRLLRYVPDNETLPVVHLNRRVDLLDAAGRAAVEAFAERFAGRIAGLVVHDRPGMRDRLSDVAEALREVGHARRASRTGPWCSWSTPPASGPNGTPNWPGVSPTSTSPPYASTSGTSASRRRGGRYTRPDPTSTSALSPRGPRPCPARSPRSGALRRRRCRWWSA